MRQSNAYGENACSQMNPPLYNLNRFFFSFLFFIYGVQTVTFKSNLNSTLAQELPTVRIKSKTFLKS